MSEGSFVENE